VDKLCSSHDPDSLPEQRNYARTYTRCLVGSRSIQHGSPPPPTVSLNAHSLPSSRAVGTNKWAPFLKVSRSGTDVLRPGSGRFFTVEMLHRRKTPSESKIHSRFTRVTSPLPSPLAVSSNDILSCSRAARLLSLCVAQELHLSAGIALSYFTSGIQYTEHGRMQ